MIPDNRLKILMLEDVESDAELVEWTLRKESVQFEKLRVDSREEFIRALKEFKPEVILSDHSLPQFNSVDAFNICKQENINVPFILVTGAVSEEFAVTSLKEGIDDYILKSNLSRLPVAIKNALHNRQLENQKMESERELKEQNELLLKINRELDNFTYNVSHNLKAPLSSVMGLINLMKIEDNNQGGKFMEIVDLIQKSIEKLNITLVSILNHSRNARTGLATDEIDIKAMIEKCFNDLNYFNGIDLLRKVIQVDSEAPFYSDPFRLDVVLNNLISNAVKYRDPNKADCFLNIRVQIDAVRGIFILEDNGIGIHDDQLPYVFDMFVRGTEMSDGAGLGLYIVKEIVDILEGEINIESKDRVGTTITLIIPNRLNLHPA